MTNPRNGPRHRSWASDTIITAAVFLAVLGTTVVVDYLNGPAPAPAYLTGLLGASATAFFAAAGSDKNKRDREMSNDIRVAKSRMLDVNETAIRAETKADDAIGRSEASAEREKGWSQHRDHRHEDGGSPDSHDGGGDPP